MDACRHHVSGFSATRDAARETFEALLEQGLPRSQIQLFATDVPEDFAPPAGHGNAVLKKVLVDGAIGTAIGTGLGALGEVALVAAPGQGWLSTLVGDAIADGQVVLVVETRTPEPTRIARDLIRASVGDYRDVVTA